MLLIRRAEVAGEIVDVRVADGRIASIEPSGSAIGGADEMIDAAGAWLLPGLHDHHLHLLAMAAARRSLDLRDLDDLDDKGLDAAVRAAHADRPPGEWLRVVGYDETVDGSLDRDRLDALAPGRPVRVQHRSGALWVLSTAAVDHVLADGSQRGPAPGSGSGAGPGAGMERDASGQPTGRFFRLDGWLGARVPRGAPPDLAAVGRRLAARGVTGVTDATPASDPAELRLLADAVERGALPQRVMVTGGAALTDEPSPPPLRRGPVKVIVADHALPSVEELERWFHRAHAAGRPVAVHCVTRVALVLALAAWDSVGAYPGDRVEHASVVPPELIARLAAHRLRVVTQPGFVFASGDRYRSQVDAVDLPSLYRCASLLEAGVAVGGSSDAPFGPDDPWQAIATAADRRTASGIVLGPTERIDAVAALDLFLSPLEDPGGPARTVRVGVRADLCLLSEPRHVVLDDPAAASVGATIIEGKVVHRA